MGPLKKFYRKYLHNYIGLSFLMSIIITLIIETAARQTPYGGILFLVQHPLIFLYNSMIIFMCFSIGLLFRHRVFVCGCIAAVWLGLGIVNGIVLANRMTPFTTGDIVELKDGLTLVGNYMSKGQVAMIIAAIAAIAAVVVISFHKAPVQVEKIHYKRAVPSVLIIIAVCMGIWFTGIKANLVESYFPNLPYGYRDNGFNYCFISTWLNKGVSRPAGYSKKEIKNVFTDNEWKTTVGNRKTDGDEKHPNIIFLQLESFVDPAICNDIKTDKDPIPNYHKLEKEYSTGKIQVPAMGAGTANTEFENMTGMSVRFFGPGEYPYKTILRKENVESIPYDLKNIGYSTHAIHNHRAAFYDRNNVFGNLGFQTFTSVEYMSDVSRTPKNWARDNVLTGQIMDALKSTKGSDYIYTISVQGHGKYPSQEVIKNPKIRVVDAPTEELKWQWEYYANQIHEMDQFVKDLTDRLKKYDEDVVLVMYGDHLPAMDNLTKSNLKPGRNIYQTDYIIWDNFDMKKKKEDLYAYQMGAEVLNRLGMHNGTMVTFHQKHKKDSNYRKELHELQYDMLYGNNYVYQLSGTKRFKPLDLKMGVKKIKIDKIVKIGSKYYIKGQNFTEYSKVTLDGKLLKTEYLGPTLLGLKEKVDPGDVKKMKISQVDENDNEILSTTE